MAANKPIQTIKTSNEREKFALFGIEANYIDRIEFD